jgi:uncharacterized protein GlcG (DUF336 family)/uncharacterized SAM-binding protein YcdF (DUF218 family)
MNELITLPYLAAGVLAPPVSLVLLALLGLLLARRRRRLGAGLAAVSLGGLLALSLPAVAMLLMDRLEPPPLSNSRATAGAGAIVILAGGVSFSAPEWGGSTVNAPTLQRLRYGAALARETRLPILVSGTAARAETAGEAALMRDMLRDEFGLPPRWVEGQSRDTAGNAVLSARMLAAERIGTVVLVTARDCRPDRLPGRRRWRAELAPFHPRRKRALCIVRRPARNGRAADLSHPRAPLTPTTESHMFTRKVLSADDVKRIAAAAEAEAIRNQWNVTIAIVDDGGHLLSLQRLDGAPPISSYIAPEKARTAALGRRETKLYEDVINQGRVSFLSAPVLQGMLEGGVPVIVDGQVIGAVGVSGVKSSEDAQIAKAGIAALG